MRKLVSRNSLLVPVLLTGLYVLVDSVMDSRIDSGWLIWVRVGFGALVLAASVLLAAFAISEKRKEALLCEAREGLEARVTERTAELERANEQLREEVAERKRVEQALRISEETSRALMDASSESAVLLDIQGRILAANETAARGLGVTVEHMLGQSLFDFFPPEVAETRSRYFEQVLATGLPVHFEDVRSGISFEIHVRPVHKEGGGIVRLAAFARDVTERKRAETALRASEEKYRLLFQNMAEGFALYELLYDEHGTAVDWQVLEVNDAYTRHTGVRAEDIVGRRMTELFPASVPEYLPRFAAVVATQVPSSFETFAAAVGRHQHISTFPAGGNRFANTIEDISGRKLAEAELRSSEEKFAKIFRFSPDAIIVIRADTDVIVDVNEGFTRLLGHERAETIGAKASDLAFISLPDKRRLIELFGAYEQVSDVEVDMSTRSGAVATMLLSMTPITLGDMPCVLMIAHDITARKRSEEALRGVQRELAIGIEARAALEERQRLARELHDSVSQALYGVALGINTALTLFESDRDKVVDALQYALSLTRAGLTEMRALIFELRPESLQKEGLVAALAKQADGLQARYGIEVGLSLCEEPGLPLQVKEALYLIAREAMQNALKHAQPSRLDLRLICRPDEITLEVCDNGVGFDPLRQYPGHLGLQSMRERARGLGGSLDIASAADCGTHIVVSVPVTPSAQGPREDVVGTHAEPR